jgi:predicted transcriptional regulator
LQTAAAGLLKEVLHGSRTVLIAEPRDHCPGIDFYDPGSVRASSWALSAARPFVTGFAAEESRAALAAIDQGIRDGEAGRTVPIEEVRKLLLTWITASPSPKGR